MAFVFRLLFLIIMPKNTDFFNRKSPLKKAGPDFFIWSDIFGNGFYSDIANPFSAPKPEEADYIFKKFIGT